MMKTMLQSSIEVTEQTLKGLQKLISQLECMVKLLSRKTSIKVLEKFVHKARTIILCVEEQTRNYDIEYWRPQISKKQRIDDKDEEKVTEVKEEEPVIRTGKRKKQKARKGINVDKSPQGDSKTDEEESEVMNPTPLDTQSNIVANWKMLGIKELLQDMLLKNLVLLEDFVDVNEFVCKPIVEKPIVETNEPKTDRKENKVPIIEEWVSDSDEENVPKVKTVKMFNKPSFAKINFIESTEEVKSPRKTLVDKNRQNTPCPSGNKRN
ncbi:hypothetical protein Tco_0596992 [Tanacetum coccineum]